MPVGIPLVRYKEDGFAAKKVSRKNHDQLAFVEYIKVCCLSAYFLKKLKLNQNIFTFGYFRN